MCKDKVLLIFGALDLEVRHFLVGEQLVVLSKDERALGLLETLDEFEVHDVVDLVVTHLYYVLGLDHLNFLLV